MKKIIIFIFIFIILLSFYLIRNILIINSIQEKSKEYCANNRYTINVTKLDYYDTSFISIIYRDGVFLQKIISIDTNKDLKENNISVSYTYFDGIDEITYLNNDNVTYIENQKSFSPIYTVESFSLISNIIKKAINDNIFYYLSFIEKSVYNSKTTYIINKKIYIDFETGLIVRIVDDNSVREINYSFEEIDEENLKIDNYRKSDH